MGGRRQRSYLVTWTAVFVVTGESDRIEVCHDLRRNPLVDGVDQVVLPPNDRGPQVHFGLHPVKVANWKCPDY